MNKNYPGGTIDFGEFIACGATLGNIKDYARGKKTNKEIVDNHPDTKKMNRKNKKK